MEYILEVERVLRKFNSFLFFLRTFYNLFNKEVMEMNKWQFLNTIFVLVAVGVLSLTNEYGLNLSDGEVLATYIATVFFIALVGMIVGGVPLLLIARILGIIEE